MSGAVPGSEITEKNESDPGPAFMELTRQKQATLCQECFHAEGQSVWEPWGEGRGMRAPGTILPDQGAVRPSATQYGGLQMWACT